MIRLIVVCEGQTEQEFCRNVLAPHLREFDVYLSAPRIEHSGGGDVRWPKVRRQLVAHLQSDTSALLTTMIDYYGRTAPHDWPNAAAASAEADVRERIGILEEGMSQEVDTEHTGRFIPHLQLHEFEALLYSDPAAITPMLEGDTDAMTSAMEAVVREAGEPELINSRRDKTPARRLAAIAPEYAKGVYGPLLAEAVGLGRMRAACPGFDRWVGRLEELGDR